MRSSRLRKSHPSKAPALPPKSEGKKTSNAAVIAKAGLIPKGLPVANIKIIRHAPSTDSRLIDQPA